MDAPTILRFYCGPSTNISDIWIAGSFNLCFLDTVSYSILLGVCVVFGIFECSMYFRHGSQCEVRLNKLMNVLYGFQIFFMLSLMILPSIEVIVLVRAYAKSFMGYQLFVSIASLLIWSFSIILVYCERHFDLPVAPARGHSLLLLLFWFLAFFADVLQMVHLSYKSWTDNFAESASTFHFSMSIVHLLFTLGTFVLGMRAPGLATLQHRLQYVRLPSRYDKTHRIVEQNGNGYGATDSTPNHSATANSLMSVNSISHSDMRTALESLQYDLRSQTLKDEFTRLPQANSALQSDAAKRQANVSINRNAKYLPYDSTRVVLQRPLNNNGNTYVNASRLTFFVPEPHSPSSSSSRSAQPDVVSRHVIAAQNPLPGSVADFWRLVAENNVGVVVLLTTQKKCTGAGMSRLDQLVTDAYQYWPGLESCEEYGDLVVTCLQETQAKRWFSRGEKHSKFAIRREFCLLSLDEQSAAMNEQTVVQYQIANDDVLASPSTLAEMVEQLLEDEQLHFCSRPILVQCSDGSTATGIFVLNIVSAMHVTLGFTVQPLNILRLMREQRPYMISQWPDFSIACQTVACMYERSLHRNQT